MQIVTDHHQKEGPMSKVLLQFVLDSSDDRRRKNPVVREFAHYWEALGATVEFLREGASRHKKAHRDALTAKSFLPHGPKTVTPLLFVYIDGKSTWAAGSLHHGRLVRLANKILHPALVTGTWNGKPNSLGDHGIPGPDPKPYEERDRDADEGVGRESEDSPLSPAEGDEEGIDPEEHRGRSQFEQRQQAGDEFVVLRDITDKAVLRVA
jgi:hypothetical protein